MQSTRITVGTLARWGLWVLACLVPLAAAHAAERRVALVIGNSAYKQAPLANPGNDARAVAQALRDAGFSVAERRNVNQIALRRAIREFGDEIAKGGVGVFFYAGHGMQVRGRNYLIPVGHDIEREDEVAEQSVDVALVLEKMATAKNALNILILDACRNNPFASSFRSTSGGLAPMDAPPGTLVAFSTAPGQVAADGTGEHSTYTKHLLSYIREPGLKVEDVFKRVRTAVRQESGGRQTPWENTSLETDFYFKAPDKSAIAAQEQERQKAQQEAIERAVQAALNRRKEPTGQERAMIEQEIAKRVAAERVAVERAAAERIAAMEKALQATAPAAEKPRAAPPAPSAVPSDPPKKTGGTPARPTADAKAATPAAPSEPVKLASIAPTTAAIAIARAAVLPSVGDTWNYLHVERDYGNKKESKYRLTVDAVTDSEIRLRTGGGTLRTFNRDGNLMRIEFKSGEVRTWEPFVPRFSYPLEPGKSWTQKYVYRRADREIDNDATSTVVGWEDVTVPAGTFRALKVSVVTWYRRKDNNFTGRWVSSHWIAPEVKYWVKAEFIDRGNNGVIYEDWSEELLSFKVK